MRYAKWIFILTMFILVACNQEDPCPELDPFCERIAEAALKMDTGNHITVGTTVLFDASSSIYDTLKWFNNRNPLSTCKDQEFCRITFSQTGEFEILVKVKVDKVGFHGETKDSSKQTIYVQAEEEVVAYTVLFSDNFNDNAIDATKWVEADGFDNIQETGSRLLLIQNPADPVSNIETVSSFSADTLLFSFYFGWIDPGADEASTLVSLYNNADNQAFIATRAVAQGGNEYVLVVEESNVVIYDTELGIGGATATGVTQPKYVMIAYNTLQDEVRFYYYNGSAYVQMGNTVSANLGNTFKFHVTSNFVTGNNADQVTLDDVTIVDGSVSDFTP